MKKQISLIPLLLLLISSSLLYGQKKSNIDQDLIGYWKLLGDAKDYSINHNDGINHGVDLNTSTFDGENSYIEIKNNKDLQFSTKDFAINVWVYVEDDIDDVYGNILSKFDPDSRTGINLSLYSSHGGYQSIGNNRHVFFGIDNGKESRGWIDCGRPSPGSNYVSNSLTVYDGELYAAIGNAYDEKDWAHVFRYEGGKKWKDLGRLGSSRTTGVLPMIVKDNQLFAITTTYDWTRVALTEKHINYDFGRVYKFGGDHNWIDYGQPGHNESFNGMAVYKKKLFTGAGPMYRGTGVFSQKTPNSKEWEAVKRFEPNEANEASMLFPHPFMVYNRKLYIGFPGVYSYDGNKFSFEGQPEGSTQLHSFCVYNGDLLVGAWPKGKVFRFHKKNDWESIGRVGESAVEVNGLVVYNGKLYSGSLPMGEVSRYDGNGIWTTLKKFYDPKGWNSVLEHNSKSEEVNARDKELAQLQGTRITSLSIYDGKLFISTGSRNTSPIDQRVDGVLGKVYYMEAGKSVTYDKNLKSGWNMLTVQRNNGYLELFVNNNLVKRSSKFDSSIFNLNNEKSLKIGFGAIDYFNGKIRDVRIYGKSLNENEIGNLFNLGVSKDQ